MTETKSDVLSAGQPERRVDDGDPFNAGWNAALDAVAGADEPLSTEEAALLTAYDELPRRVLDEAQRRLLKSSGVVTRRSVVMTLRDLADELEAEALR